MRAVDARNIDDGASPSEPSAHRRYLICTIVSLAAAHVLTALFCAWQNPFDILPSKDAKLFQPRISKVHLASRIQPRTIIIGSSRPELGIPAEHKAWARPPVLNMAFSGTSAAEMCAWFEHCCAVSPVEQALIMLDYSSCDRQTKHQYTFDPGRLHTLEHGPLWTSQIADLRMAFASWDGLSAAIECLRTPPENRDFLPQGGRNEKVHYGKILSKGGLRRLFHLTDTRFPLQKTDLDKEWRPIRRMVSVAAAKKVRLTWIISPFHNHFWSLYIKRDGIDEVLGWRRALVHVIQEEADACGLGRQTFWDFDDTTPTRMSVDDIISDASNGRLPIFYEYSHFSSRVGALMLERALQSTAEGSPAFGVPVTSDNLEERLQVLRKAWTPKNIP
jgi:hypothetical protein